MIDFGFVGREYLIIERRDAEVQSKNYSQHLCTSAFNTK